MPSEVKFGAALAYKIRNQPLTNQQYDQPLYKGTCRLVWSFLFVDMWKCCAIVCMVRSWPEMVAFHELFLSNCFHHLGLFRVGNFPSLPRCRVLQCVCRFLFFERSILNVLIRLNLGDCMISRRLQHTKYEQHRSFDIWKFRINTTCVWWLDDCSRKRGSLPEGDIS